MTILDNIFNRLGHSPDETVLREVRGGRLVSYSGRKLSDWIRATRIFLQKANLKKGGRCVLLAPNSAQWVAVNLALMAEGLIVVPLYTRQSWKELVPMMKDCSPGLILCGREEDRSVIHDLWADRPPIHLLEEVLIPENDPEGKPDKPDFLTGEDPMTLIYTSGTSGEPKGVILNVANLNHMLACTTARLDLLMGMHTEPEQVFHYLPFCFAGSWIVLLSCLSRNSVLTLSTDLNNLADELRLAAPQYLLNVPALLERIRKGVEEKIQRGGGLIDTLYQRGKAAWICRQTGRPRVMDKVWLWLAKIIVFAGIRKKLGSRLKALICGSAALAKDTQLFFMMLGIPVLQVYGLTETTAICTMDHPDYVVPGRVGPAITGIEMKLGENDEILVKGPNIFPGYWNRPQETADTFAGEWFRTGDQGEVDTLGNWRIIGRIKNLIVLSSGHNIAPEPLEDAMQRTLPGAQQVMLVGNSRSFLSAIVTGSVTRDKVEACLEIINTSLPHYKKIRAYHLQKEPFGADTGMVTANGKLRRGVITAYLESEIEALYNKQRTNG